MATDGPDRINVSVDAWDLVQKIEKKKLFGLNEITRSELYCLAMAFGLEGTPTAIKKVHQGGLVLDKSIDGLTSSLMTALSVHIAATDNLEELDNATNKRNIFSISDAYANTGFALLENIIEDCKDDEAFVLTIMSQLDELYEEIISY